MLTVIQMTTFGGRGLTDRDSPYRLLYLPVDPAPAHPDNGKRLTFENGGKLATKAWVNIKTIECPMAALRPWGDINFGKAQPKVCHLRLPLKATQTS